MPRTGPSAADAALIAKLNSKGLRVSAAQLERWRTVGVVPRNKRTHLGRGKGSKSTIPENGEELAEAMARVYRRGRSVYEATLRIFTVNPSSLDLFEPCLPISEKAIRSSLNWFVQHGDQSVHRRVERALRRTKARGDEAADLIIRVASQHYRNTVAHPPPTAEHRPPIWSAKSEEEIQNLTVWLLGNFLGANEVGAQKLAEIIAEIGPSTATDAERESTRAVMEELFAARELAGDGLPSLDRVPGMEETITRLNETDIARIRELRNKFAIVAEMGFIYLNVRGSEDFEDFSMKVLEASTESLSASMLLYAAAPISATLESSAWHTMAALIIMVLEDDESEYYDALDKLTKRIAPGRLAHSFSE
ncbi:hypothetical protein [Streptomyces chartreusis]|uniref:hypothetical protein n=1 Tax=Streptomyces chartreusis TaxID=1969 RepID=UPI00386B0377|nr:hypothetical protein OG938_28325 [Streptomyces chartreusis]